MLKALHIIAFDIPYPANYGGVIDVYHKILAFKELGYKIHLHCFQYGKKPSSILDGIADRVFYYPRKMNLLKHFNKRPFIVNSRQDNRLLQNLLENDWPIWMEGIHTTYYLNHELLKTRIMLVRCHNVERDYYNGLSNSVSFGIKKLYYKIESWKLKAEERKLSDAHALFAISKKDQEYFAIINPKTYCLPASIKYKPSENKNTLANAALYHGNLSVVENQKAVQFLLNVFENLSEELIIAGKDAPSNLKKQIRLINNISLIENPSEEKLSNLINECRVNCLPSFQSTGIKLKLLRALMEGNKVIANDALIKGSDLGEFCTVANGLNEWQSAIKKAFSENLDRNAIQARQKEIRGRFDSTKNLSLAMEWLAEVQ